MKRSYLLHKLHAKDTFRVAIALGCAPQGGAAKKANGVAAKGRAKF